MPRKPTAIGQIKALLKAHEPYKAYKWRCTGRHRHVMDLLSICTPLECPNGHRYNSISEIPMRKYLKKDIERIYQNATREPEYELGA